MAESKKELLEAQKEKLDQFVVNIEFLLISVIQGVAIGTLATGAVAPFVNMEYGYMLYVISGFLFILNFWSQAIIHTLSFIDWPLDMAHNFLYFLVGLVEVMAFTQITNPLNWFGLISLFFIAAGALYYFDLSLIKKHEKKFQDSEERKALFKHMYEREMYEAKFFLPAAIFFNIGSFLLIYIYPNIFIDQNYHIILILLQVIFGAYFLRDSINNFRMRTKLISQNIQLS